jgi:DNA-binding beta-propeller fold protein YncE
MTNRNQRFGLAVIFAAVLMQLPGGVHAGPSNLYVVNPPTGTVRQFSQSGTDLGNFATGLSGPCWFSRDGAGNLYVSSNVVDRVIEYSLQGTVKLTISTTFTPADVQITASGNILVADSFGSGVYKYSSTGQSLGLFSSLGLSRADFMAFDSQGNLYVTDPSDGVVRKISPSGVDEGNFLTHVLGITGISFDPMGNLYAAFATQAGSDTDMIRKYSASGQDLGLITSTGLNQPFGIAFGPNGNLYVANSGSNTIHEFSPAGADLGVFASTGLSEPRDLVFDSSVPEPSSLLLMAIGVTLGAGFLRSRFPRGGSIPSALRI